MPVEQAGPSTQGPYSEGQQLCLDSEELSGGQALLSAAAFASKADDLGVSHDRVGAPFECWKADSVKEAFGEGPHDIASLEGGLLMCQAVRTK
jgi:hypothetical protein